MCETKGMPIVEFVGLRPKMYSYLYQNSPSPVAMVIEKHRVKCIASSASRALRHYQYKEQLETPHENYITNRRLGSRLHKIYAISCEKRGLCSFDDKRFLLDDNKHSLAYGHYSITNQVHRDDIKNSTSEQVMSAKEVRDKGLIWSRRQGVLPRSVAKEEEWSTASQEAVLKGVKARLDLRGWKENTLKGGFGKAKEPAAEPIPRPVEEEKHSAKTRVK